MKKLQHIIVLKDINNRDINFTLKPNISCCVKFVTVIIKMIKIWLKEDSYVMLLYFGVLG